MKSLSSKTNPVDKDHNRQSTIRNPVWPSFSSDHKNTGPAADGGPKLTMTWNYSDKVQHFSVQKKIPDNETTTCKFKTYKLENADKNTLEKTFEKSVTIGWSPHKNHFCSTKNKKKTSEDDSTKKVLNPRNDIILNDNNSS